MKREENILDGKIKFVRITKEYLSENLEDFLAIENNWTDLGEAAWSKDNFLLELPLKWNLSFAAEKKGIIVGYILGSMLEHNISRVNKIVVDYNHRKSGIGKKLIELYFEACIREKIKKLELKALIENEAANNFYVKHGYQKVGSVRGTDGLMRIVYEKILSGVGERL